METNGHIANIAIRSMTGITAFSALPDAPVLPYKERQQRLSLARLARSRVRGAPRPPERFAPATASGPACM
jgi:hypothetical protein